MKYFWMWDFPNKGFLAPPPPKVCEKKILVFCYCVDTYIVSHTLYSYARKPVESEIGLNPISRKKYLISNLIIYFRFPRACLRNYTMRALLYKCQHTSKISIFYFRTLLEGGGGPKNPLLGKSHIQKYFIFVSLI